MDQLYLTMASVLKRLQGIYLTLSYPCCSEIVSVEMSSSYSSLCYAANLVSAGSETIEDVRRLSTIFGHVEKLMIVAASLHRKFLHAPSIAEAIFNDYHKFHSRKMGTSTIGEDDKTVRMSLLTNFSALANGHHPDALQP